MSFHRFFPLRSLRSLRFILFAPKIRLLIAPHSRDPFPASRGELVRLTSFLQSQRFAAYGMTFLPIVDRELRVTARRRSIYRARLAVALAAMFLAGIILVINLGAPQHLLGRYVFEGLS